MKHVKLYHSQVIQVIPTSDHSCARDPYKYTANIRSVQGTLPLPNPIGDNMLIVRVTTVYGLHILLFIPCQHELDYTSFCVACRQTLSKSDIVYSTL